jgi:Spx/MgsR family transcriptional regulator
MNIQIIGTKNCSNTRKAERFFKERNIPFHFRDLNEKSLAKGELDNIVLAYPPDELIDREGKQFKKRNMQYIKFEVLEELMNDSLLLKTPIVRNGRNVTIGFQPDTWSKWIKEN